ncbi:MAG: ergothioneine biosynthesis protein EgtB [Gammaproteobacteria bacterium]|nr:ergothioneine biosynthesis protein EgtB [Gammaproteobacteria bacterium]
MSLSHVAQTTPVTPHCHAKEDLQARYRGVRQDTEDLCRPLATEDYCIQTEPFVSPTKWHIAHISWFFEAFVLKHFEPAYREFDPRFDYLFNSYYVTHSEPYPRPERGLLSRPTVDEIYRYRAHVDDAILELIDSADDDLWQALSDRVILGLNHEQQHQELMLTDIKHVFARNPLRPAYREINTMTESESNPMRWIEFDGGVRDIGHDDDDDFCFDSETPRHHVLTNDHVLASRLVTNGEYIEFIEAGGYGEPDHWLSDGWSSVCQHKWEAPSYWERQDSNWWQMTLGGMRRLNEHEPVCHVSFYEADAYARWAGRRLPTEAELELIAVGKEIEGNLREADRLHPTAAPSGDGLVQVYGDVWEWTQSPYAPYPGFVSLDGSLGEYNGKFMCNQMVLRGGSCVTPRSHMRATYRNFFYPPDRWQFTGIRLAGDF